MRMQKDDLNDVAREWINGPENTMQVHRGVIHYGDGIQIAFGNDGYAQGGRAANEAETIIRYCIENSWPVSDVQTCAPDHISWCVAVHTGFRRKPIKPMLKVLWDAWDAASSAKKGGSILVWNELTAPDGKGAR